MSDLFDSELVVSVRETPTLIHQPTTDGVAMSCLLSNGHYGTLPLSVWIERGDVVVHLAPAVRVRAGASHEALAGSKVALKAGDKVYASCPVAGAFSGILSAYKDK